MSTSKQTRWPTGSGSQSTAAERGCCKKALPAVRAVSLALTAAACTLLTAMPFAAKAQHTLYSNNFESYSTGIYPFPSNPLPGWNAMPSQSGLQPWIVSPPVTGTGKVLEVNSIGGGASGWMSVASQVLAGSTSDWSASANARYLASNNPGSQPWYAWGGLLLSSTGDMSGDWLVLGIDVGWGEFSPNVTWARPMAAWSLGGVSGGGTLFPPVVDSWGAIRMSSDATYGPAGLTVSRTNSSSSISFVINSPVDGPRTATLSFTGAEAAALNNLQYVGFGQYFNKWEYDNLVVTGNHSPAAPAITTGAPAGATSNIRIIDGKPGMSPTDADGDALLVSYVQNPSALLGATVTTDGTNIFYTPGLNASGADTVQYAVSDGYGGYGTNTMYVTVSGQSLNIVSGPTLTNNQFRVTFAGIPNFTYAVDNSTNSASGPWAFFSNLAAGSNGLFQLVAPNDPPAGQRFFRTRPAP